MVLTNPCEGKYREYAVANLKTVMRHGLQPVEAGCFHGKVLALCGAGPSLAAGPLYPADELWGCNSAVTWLAAHDKQPTGAVAIDQTAQMVEEWRDTPAVTHYVASTVDPRLLEHLVATGRDVRIFHNYVGFDDEIEFYNSKPWPASFMMATGATVLSRTVGLAAWMGFRRIDVYGADCSFRDGIAHANGESIEEAFGQTTVMEGDVGGRIWQTRPDMLMCAVDLVRLTRTYPDRLRLMGDTLPVALMGYDDAFLDQVIRRVAPGEKLHTGD